jgi:hypothetical protein
MSTSFARRVRLVLHRVDPDLAASADDPLGRAGLTCNRAIDRARHRRDRRLRTCPICLHSVRNGI